jgi:hypothetical protein
MSGLVAAATVGACCWWDTEAAGRGVGRRPTWFGSCGFWMGLVSSGDGAAAIRPLPLALVPEVGQPGRHTVVADDLLLLAAEEPIQEAGVVQLRLAAG